MANKQATLPNGLRDMDRVKAILASRREGLSLADVSLKHCGNQTRLPADLRKAKELVENGGNSQDAKVAKCILDKWDEASKAAGKGPSGSRAKPLAAADAKAMIDALKDC